MILWNGINMLYIFDSISCKLSVNIILLVPHLCSSRKSGLCGWYKMCRGHLYVPLSILTLPSVGGKSRLGLNNQNILRRIILKALSTCKVGLGERNPYIPSFSLHPFLKAPTPCRSWGSGCWTNLEDAVPVGYPTALGLFGWAAKPFHSLQFHCVSVLAEDLCCYCSGI